MRVFHYTRGSTPKCATSLITVVPIPMSLRPGNIVSFEDKSQRWRAVGNTVSDLTGPRFEPQTSRSRDQRVTARPTESLQIIKSVDEQNGSLLWEDQRFLNQL